MKLGYQDENELERWITNKLASIKQSNPEVLAKYVISLVKQEKDSDSSIDFFIDDLEPFLKDRSKFFVESLFSVLRDNSFRESYVPEEEQEDRDDREAGRSRGRRSRSGSRDDFDDYEEDDTDMNLNRRQSYEPDNEPIPTDKYNSINKATTGYGSGGSNFINNKDKNSSRESDDRWKYKQKRDDLGRQQNPNRNRNFPNNNMNNGSSYRPYGKDRFYEGKGGYNGNGGRGNHSMEMTAAEEEYVEYTKARSGAMNTENDGLTWGAGGRGPPIDGSSMYGIPPGGMNMGMGNPFFYGAGPNIGMGMPMGSGPPINAPMGISQFMGQVARPPLPSGSTPQDERNGNVRPPPPSDPAPFGSRSNTGVGSYYVNPFAVTSSTGNINTGNDGNSNLLPQTGNNTYNKSHYKGFNPNKGIGGQHNKQEQSLPENERCTLRCTGIPHHVSEDDVRAHFASFGHIVELQMSPMQPTNTTEEEKKKVYNECLVQFLSPQNAKKCLSSPTPVLNNRFIHLYPSHFNITPPSDVEMPSSDIMDNDRFLLSQDIVPRTSAGGNVPGESGANKRKSHGGFNMYTSKVSNKYRRTDEGVGASGESKSENHGNEVGVITSGGDNKDDNEKKMEGESSTRSKSQDEGNTEKSGNEDSLTPKKEHVEMKQQFNELRSLRQQAEEILKQKESILQTQMEKCRKMIETLEVSEDSESKNKLLPNLENKLVELQSQLRTVREQIEKGIINPEIQPQQVSSIPTNVGGRFGGRVGGRFAPRGRNPYYPGARGGRGRGRGFYRGRGPPGRGRFGGRFGSGSMVVSSEYDPSADYSGGVQVETGGGDGNGNIFSDQSMIQTESSIEA